MPLWIGGLMFSDLSWASLAEPGLSASGALAGTGFWGGERISERGGHSNSGLTRGKVHVNTIRVNTIKPLIERIIPLLERRLPVCLRKRQARPGRVAIQLEFPWQLKK
jgi:hypothetical protein